MVKCEWVDCPTNDGYGNCECGFVIDGKCTCTWVLYTKKWPEEEERESNESMDG